jgi:hypothetical protein
VAPGGGYCSQLSTSRQLAMRQSSFIVRGGRTFPAKEPRRVLISALTASSLDDGDGLHRVATWQILTKVCEGTARLSQRGPQQ